MSQGGGHEAVEVRAPQADTVKKADIKGKLLQKKVIIPAVAFFGMAVVGFMVACGRDSSPVVLATPTMPPSPAAAEMIPATATMAVIGGAGSGASVETPLPPAPSAEPATPAPEITSTKTLSETTAADLGLPEGAKVEFEKDRFWVTGYGAEKFVLGAPTRKPTQSIHEVAGGELKCENFRIYAQVASQPFTDTFTLVDEQGNEQLIQSASVNIKIWDSATEKFLTKKAIVTLNQQDGTELMGEGEITYDANYLFYTVNTAVKSSERKWQKDAIFRLSIDTNSQLETGYDATNPELVKRVTFENSLFGHPHRGFHLKENVNFPSFEALEKWQKTGIAPEAEYLGLVSISCPLPPPKPLTTTASTN